MDVVAISAQLGLFAIWLLTLNVALGLLLSSQYNPLKRWPHKRINYFAVHNWAGYIALALTVAHAAILPLSSTAGWVWRDVLWPSGAPQQATANVWGAISMYLLAVVVVTSYVRRKMGRGAWKAVHYASFVCAILFVLHGAVLDPKLENRPINYFDPEKASIVLCAAVMIWGTWLRARWALRRRARRREKDLRHWDAPSPVEWSEGPA
ncbi:MAG: ferric reductase-like transmembrane domain-containing protein [Gemmatimonadota bacterium]|jgi:predicted ferric reductase